MTNENGSLYLDVGQGLPDLGPLGAEHLAQGAVQLVEDVALPPGRAPTVHQLVEEHAVQEAREEVLGVLDRDIGAPETEEGGFVEADEGFRVYPDQSQARSVAL